MWCGKLPAIGGTAELLLIGATNWKHQAFRIACSEREWTNAFGIGSCISWFTMKYCACAPIAFLARIISCFVDSTFFYILGSTQPLAEMNTGNIFWGYKRLARRATTLPPLCPYCLGIWKPQPPRTLWACQDLYRDCFTFTLHFSISIKSQIIGDSSELI